MITLSEAVAIIALGISFITVVLNLRSSKKKDDDDIEQRVIERTETNMKLDEIGRNVNEIKDSVRETKKDIQGLAERQAIIDAKAEKAHLRIDIMEATLKAKEEVR